MTLLCAVLCVLVSVLCVPVSVLCASDELYRSCQGVTPEHLVGKYYIVPAQVKHVVELQLCIIDLPTVRKRSNATMHFFDISL